VKELGVISRIVLPHRQDERDGVLAVCRLGDFLAAFALLGGQEVIEKWVLSLNMTPVQFMILAQFIILHPRLALEWTEIIIISCRSSCRCCRISTSIHCSSGCCGVEPADRVPVTAGGDGAFYLKGVSPPHVTSTDLRRDDAFMGFS